MIVTKDNERLYLTTWNYNAARIMSELAKIVVENGGRVKRQNTAIVSDRHARSDAKPIIVTHTTHISFALADTCYYFQVDDNPFFPFFCSKTPIISGKYSQDACAEEDKKEWLLDCFFAPDCSAESIRASAQSIFEMLTAAKLSYIRRDKVRRHVSNTYGGGYHMETVYKPERMTKIDF